MGLLGFSCCRGVSNCFYYQAKPILKYKIPSSKMTPELV